MSLSVSLPSDLENRLIQESQRLGISPDVVAFQLLDQHLPKSDSSQELLALLDSWIQQDSTQEHQDTGQILVSSLNEERLSLRPLFPPELKGITW